MTATIDELKLRTERRKTNEQARYIILARKIGLAGSLTPGETDELEGIMCSLGLEIETVHRDAAAVSRHAALKQKAKDIPALSGAFRKAAEAHKAHKIQTSEILSARRLEEAKLQLSAGSAQDALREAEKADEELARLESDYRPLFEVERGPRKPACLLRHDDSVRDEFLKRENDLKHLRDHPGPAVNEGWSSDRHRERVSKQLAELVEEKTAALAALDKLAKSAPAGAVLFHLSDADLNEDPMQRVTCGVDLDLYDFQPIKGQAKQEFDDLLARLRRVCALRDRQNNKETQ